MMLLRVAFAWALLRWTTMDQTAVWWSFVLSWAATLILVQIHYFRGTWRKRGLHSAKISKHPEGQQTAET